MTLPKILSFARRKWVRRSEIAQTVELAGFASIIAGGYQLYGTGVALVVAGLAMILIASFAVDRP